MNKEFKWTDETVKELMASWYSGDNLSKCIERFKESKQPKPEWEIMSYQHKKTKEVAPKGSIGFCKAMHNHEHETYQVKRLSDGEVFTIGDRVKYHKTSHYGWYIIEGFFVRGDGQLLARNKDQNIVEYITEIVKAPELLFTTEDGVAIYNGDSIWYVNTNNYSYNEVINLYKYSPDKCEKCFSTQDKAEEYILMNKPLLSLTDLVKMGYTRTTQLINKAKEKLNKP